MEVYVRQRIVYGATLYDPACRLSQCLVRMLGQKTLTHYQIHELLDVGVQVHVIH